ncbi:UNKNOWN [Stylonychia lemnae]|uniref:Uncharacterized protein n=1 Tax=Stylonychia lemnae TaxID=5949 RepID=A0A078BEF1_STYLE|nr:UNKNOWN [Stylonychia lemnae]|eukprot:CDW91527.1 UNKNOWN [Stylonychia lemnae]
MKETKISQSSLFPRISHNKMASQHVSNQDNEQSLNYRMKVGRYHLKLITNTRMMECILRQSFLIYTIMIRIIKAFPQLNCFQGRKYICLTPEKITYELQTFKNSLEKNISLMRFLIKLRLRRQITNNPFVIQNQDFTQITEQRFQNRKNVQDFDEQYDEERNLFKRKDIETPKGKVSEYLKKPDFDYYRQEKEYDLSRMKNIIKKNAQNEIVMNEINGHEPRETKLAQGDYGSKFAFSFQNLAQKFREQIGIDDQYIEDKIRVIQHERAQKQRAIIAQQELEQKIREEQELNDLSDPTKANVGQVFANSNFRQIRAEKQKQFEKQQISKGIICKAIREMRARFHKLIQKAILSFCVKIYFRTGFKIHQFNKDLHELKQKRAVQNAMKKIRFGQEIATIPKINLNGRVKINLNKTPSPNPQIFINQNSKPDFPIDFLNQDQNQMPQKQVIDLTKVTKKRGRKSPQLNELEVPKLRDYSRYLKEYVNNTSSILKGGLTRAGKNMVLDQHSKELLRKKYESLKHKLPNSELEQRFQSLHKTNETQQKYDENDELLEEILSTLRDENTHRFVMELGPQQEERNGIYSIMLDPDKKKKELQRKLQEKKEQQEQLNLQKQREEHKMKIKQDWIRRKNLISQKTNKSPINHQSPIKQPQTPIISTVQEPIKQTQ